MIDLTMLREITEKVRGIAYDQNDGNGVTAVLPSEVFAVCQAAEIGLLLLGAFDSPAAALDHARCEYVAKQDFTAASRCRAWRDALKGADDGR